MRGSAGTTVAAAAARVLLKTGVAGLELGVEEVEENGEPCVGVTWRGVCGGHLFWPRMKGLFAFVIFVCLFCLFCSFIWKG